MSASQIRKLDVRTRDAEPEDAEHFAELLVESGPVLMSYLFGPGVKNIARRMYPHDRNCFSFEHARFIEADGVLAGMALAYSQAQKKDEDRRSGWLIVRYMKLAALRQMVYLRKSDAILAQITESEYYLSNMATYPELRGLGLGTMLMHTVEEEAAKAGSKRLALDVETDNEEAVKLYRRLGYEIELTSPVLRIRDRRFQFYKMARDL